MDYMSILDDERLNPHLTVLTRFTALLSLLARNDIIQTMTQACGNHGGCPLAAAMANLEVFRAFQEAFPNCDGNGLYIGDQYPNIHHFPSAIGAYVGVIMMEHGFQKMNDSIRYPMAQFIKSAACFEQL